MIRHIFLLLLLPVFTANAQDYQYVYKVDKHLSIVGQNDLSGLLYDGKLILPLEYNAIEPYEQYLLLRKDNLTGVASKQGKIIVPVIYEDIDDNSNGFLTLYNKLQFGLVDYNGQFILPMSMHVFTFTENTIIVSQFEQQGVVDFEGNILVPLRSGVISQLDDQGYEFLVEGPDGSYLFLRPDSYLLDGYLPVSDRLFAKTTDVTIRDYFAFLSDQKVHGDLENSSFVALFPDTTQVEQKLKSVYRSLIAQLNMPQPSQKITYVFHNVKSQFSVPLFFKPDKQGTLLLDLPVTGVTPQQQLAYAEWLTKLYDERTAPQKNYAQLVLFRMPTDEEREALQLAGFKPVAEMVFR